MYCNYSKTQEDAGKTDVPRQDFANFYLLQAYMLYPTMYGNVSEVYLYYYFLFIHRKIYIFTVDICQSSSGKTTTTTAATTTTIATAVKSKVGLEQKFIQLSSVIQISTN